jgi:hypothetical protein
MQVKSVSIRHIPISYGKVSVKPGGQEPLDGVKVIKKIVNLSFILIKRPTFTIEKKTCEKGPV